MIGKKEHAEEVPNESIDKLFSSEKTQQSNIIALSCDGRKRKQ
jgi:hypothetical protein